MQDVIKAYAGIARISCIIAGWALMAISIGATLEVLSRKFLNLSFQGLDEIGGYMMAAVSAVGFAYALTTRSHMRVTLLFPYVSRSVQAWLNVIAMVTLAGMAVFCAYRGIYEVGESLSSLKRSNTPLQVPLWIPQAFWFYGMALFAFGTVLTAIDAISLLFTDRSTLNRLYGPQSLEEEISMEVKHAAERERVAGTSKS